MRPVRLGTAVVIVAAAAYFALPLHPVRENAGGASFWGGGVYIAVFSARRWCAAQPPASHRPAAGVSHGETRSFAQPYIIAMTASALVEDQTACAAAGMDDYLAKPVRAAEPAQALERASHSAAAAPRPAR